MNSKLRFGVMLVALGLALVAAGPAFAQATSGTTYGNSGGAYNTWNMDLPADTDVTLSLQHWPCLTGTSVGINVWGADGLLATSTEKDACTQEATFNTGDGGAAEIQMYDYLHGVAMFWSLQADGIALGAAPAAPVEATAEEATTEGATTAGATTEEATTEETTTEAATVETTAAEETSGAASLTESATLFGDIGGAHDSYDLAVEEGKSYHVSMTVGTDRGGQWNGVGFDVWGPGGEHIASGKHTAFNVIEATFTADGNVVYLIQPYNYHHGLTAFYSLEASLAD